MLDNNLCYIVDNRIDYEQIVYLYVVNGIPLVFSQINSLINLSDFNVPPHKKTKIILGHPIIAERDVNLYPHTKNISLIEGLQIMLEDIKNNRLSLDNSSPIFVCKRTFIKSNYPDTFLAVSICSERVYVIQYKLEPQSDILFERKVISREEAA